jgi:hypothetical protein
LKIETIESEALVSVMWNPETTEHPRSPGLHLTDIVYPMMKELGEVPDRPDLTTTDLEAYRSMGFLWERILTEALQRKAEQDRKAAEGNWILFRPGEIVFEDIFMTPDAAILDTDGMMLEEWKATYTSSNRPIEFKKQWWIQIMSYLKGLGLTQATVRVLHICGNWRPSIPCVKMYRATFNQREIDENWMMVVNYGKKLGLIK